MNICPSLRVGGNSSAPMGYSRLLCGCDTGYNTTSSPGGGWLILACFAWRAPDLCFEYEDRSHIRTNECGLGEKSALLKSSFLLGAQTTKCGQRIRLE